MVLKHNKRPFTNVESCEHAYKHARRFECGGHLISFTEISSFRVAAQESPVSESKDSLGQFRDEECLGADDICVSSVIKEDFDITGDDLNVNGHPARAICEVSSLSWNTNGEVVRSEHRKWPLSDDESYQPVYKSPSRLDQNYQQNTFPGIQPISCNCEGPPTSAVAGEELENNRASAFNEDSSRSGYGSYFGAPFLTSGPIRDIKPELPVRTSSFPGYFEDEYQMSETSQLEDVHSQFFDFPYRKPVALGPNHQADIPARKGQDPKNSSGNADYSVGSTLASALVHPPIDDDNSEKWVGNCVMPMPVSGLSASELEIQGRTDCSCLDEGSIRCVRQHVMEAREKLEQTLGQSTFIKLGFCDMGEDVAQKWSEEEEQAFHEVVLSYPASLGKNFWKYLHQVLPSRSSKELVSYYFNVFMLRKRAEQNRLDPLNADSDNDEWQESDDGESEEEDSVVESPTYGYDVTCNDDSQMTGIHQGYEDGDACDDCAADVDEKEGPYDKYVSEQHVNVGAKNVLEDAEDHDCQDDSCTTYEGHHNGADSCGGSAEKLEAQYGLVEEHKDLDRVYKNDGVCGSNVNGYDVGHCDLRSWDGGYLCGADKEIDFLPTCNVIEEVCGKGTWEEAVDGHGVT